MNVDWPTLLEDVKTEVVSVLRVLVDGAEEDVKTFGAAIASDLVRAVRDGREDLESELSHQARVLGEINRIRVVKVTWDEVGKVLTSIGKVALKALAAAAL